MIRKILFLFACVFLYNNVAYAKIVINELPKPLYMNTDGTTYDVANEDETNEKPVSENKTRTITTSKPMAVSNNALNRIEKKVYGRDFRGDVDANRIARVERQVFGAVQGGSLNSRLSRLQTATAGYNTVQNTYDPYYPNTYGQSAYGQNSQNNSGGGILRKALNVLGSGSLTGYSPNVNAFDPKYGSYYGQNPYSNSYQSPYSNPNLSPYNAYYNGTKNYQNPYSGSTSFYNPTQTMPTVTRVVGPNGKSLSAGTPTYVKSNTGYRDIFSDGGGGQEMYYDDGRFSKDIRSTDGGCSVTIID